MDLVPLPLFGAAECHYRCHARRISTDWICFGSRPVENREGFESPYIGSRMGGPNLATISIAMIRGDIVVVDFSENLGLA